jgi:hypothetical protein
MADGADGTHAGGRLGRALGAVIEGRLRHGQRGRLAAAVGRNRSTLRYWFKAEPPVPDWALPVIARFLETTPEELRAAAHVVAAGGATGRLPAGPATLASRNGAESGGGETVEDGAGVEDDPAQPGTPAVLSAHGEARFCPGYLLWRRPDPAAAASRRLALSPGMRVMCDDGDGGLPGEVFVVRVDDPGPLAAAGLGAGDRVFVDRGGAERAQPGAPVAAMTAHGLSLGNLERDAAGRWFLRMGREREEIDRGAVRGTVIKAQSPDRWYVDFGAPAPEGEAEPEGAADA